VALIIEHTNVYRPWLLPSSSWRRDEGQEVQQVLQSGHKEQAKPTITPSHDTRTSQGLGGRWTTPRAMSLAGVVHNLVDDKGDSENENGSPHGKQAARRFAATLQTPKRRSSGFNSTPSSPAGRT
ncbi:1918_t:CDS:2, partial [Acaulospora colombiana]